MPQLLCKACTTPIPADDVHLDSGYAKCRACHAVFNFRESSSSTERPPVPLPAKMTARRDAGTLSIEWRWFRPTLFFLVFFCIAWDSFLIFWYAVVFTALKNDDFDHLRVIFLIAHVAVGALLTYATIAGFVNRTRIQVDRDRLVIRHGPVPWRGNMDVPSREIAQISCTEQTHRGKHGTVLHTYTVRAHFKNGTTKDIVKKLEAVDQALYLEQQIEKHLSIADKPVAGEVPR